MAMAVTPLFPLIPPLHANDDDFSLRREIDLEMMNAAIAFDQFLSLVCHAFLLTSAKMLPFFLVPSHHRSLIQGDWRLVPLAMHPSGRKCALFLLSIALSLVVVGGLRDYWNVFCGTKHDCYELLGVTKVSRRGQEIHRHQSGCRLDSVG